jgi:nucleoside-triphosphatase THEP1
MPDIVIVTGAINSGKTSYLEKLIAQERTLGKSPSGIIAHGVFKDNHKIGYDIEDIASGMTLPLARAGSHKDGDQMVGQYSFSKKTLEFAKGALLNYTSGGVVFLDEAGPLELAGEGYAFCISALLDSHISKLYLVVREGLVDQVTERFLQGRSVKLLKVGEQSSPKSPV